MATSLARKKLGAFYTPDGLAKWVAAELFTSAADTNSRIKSVVDPACGDGALLAAMRSLTDEPISLTGIDIDPVAVAQCRETLGPISNILLGDALSPEFQAEEFVSDAVILNPPWGGMLAQHRQFYRDGGYRLASGQFDISDLFVERALSITRPGGFLGLILPDAVFQSDHHTLREMLLENTLLLIARLGEGVFDDVYRSTTVIVLRREPALADHSVECLQFSATQRRELIQGIVSFKDIKDLHSHRVPQARFAANQQSVFNITQAESDYSEFSKFSWLPVFNWQENVHLARGIEIGKRGITVCCKYCGNHRPAPTGHDSVLCKSCSFLIESDAPRHEIIKTISDVPGWYPLIVGEDVDRYLAIPRRSIKLDVPGIRYKPMEHFAARKLLIRKTGVGLRAAVDGSGAATIQTVFHIITVSEEGDWLLDYLQGMINSRPLLAWYLRWSGENQWRSHPYVTPKVLRGLPIPDPFTHSRITGTARMIADQSRRARAGSVSAEDAVDELVCRLYDLDDEGTAWVDSVLADTEDHLEYFMQMKQRAVHRTVSNERAKAYR